MKLHLHVFDYHSEDIRVQFIAKLSLVKTSLRLSYTEIFDRFCKKKESVRKKLSCQCIFTINSHWRKNVTLYLNI